MSEKNAEQAVAGDVRNIWHHLTLHQGTAPLIMEKGRGMRLTDIHGREYLDATSGGVWCVNVGYGRDRIADAVAAQMKTMAYYAATGGNLPAVEFAERLLGHMPGLAKVYFSNSGAEANEKAYKMVRQRAHLGPDKNKTTILYRDRDYHGTTIGALSSCGQPERKAHFGPFAPGFAEVPHACCYRCAFGKRYPGCDLDCAGAVEAAILKEGPDSVGGAVFEPVTAGGGIIPPVPEYYETVAAICKRYGVLLIMDEVVCGIGRTGTMFGYQQYGILPDIVAMAKGVASAYMPISCTVTTEAVFASLQSGADALSYFRDISTYGGCAAGPAAAVENLKIIEEEKLLDNVRSMGAYLLEGLRECLAHPNAGDARGMGLLLGLELVEDKKSKAPLPEEKVMAVCAEAAARGVLLGRSNRSFTGFNNVIFLAPAYVIAREDADTILETLRESMKAVLG